MALAGFGGPPDVVHEFMVVKGEIAGNVAMPLGKLGASAEVQLVILPDPELQERYAQQLERYRNLYQSLRPAFAAHSESGPS